jgi:hypothetical protein
MVFSLDDSYLCYLSRIRILVPVPTDAEITFADHAGRLYANRYGMAPMVGAQRAFPRSGALAPPRSPVDRG